ncbi:MAG TPA: alpha/beta hydrolase [Actinomycetota bacterium]|nr:alpha/beta hydrolase [Actinomycetota bacterium]
MIQPTVRGALAVLLVTAACTTEGDPSRPGATYAEVPCPGMVTAQILLETSCGYLTVPETRGDAESRMIRLLVTRVTPPGARVGGEPMLVVGTDLAAATGYGGVAPMAERIGREVIMLDARGTGLSQPRLDCPEVDEVADVVLAAPSSDDRARELFLEAVGGCHRRLAEGGVDVSAYNVEAMAADADDLRRALGIEAWGVTALGTTSRIALEMMRRDRGHISEVVLDAPEFPQNDPVAEAGRWTEAAIDELAAACAADRRCDARFPTPRSRVRDVLDQVQAGPVPATVDVGTEELEVLLDGSRYLLALRHLLSVIGHRLSPDGVVGLVAAISEGPVGPVELLASLEPNALTGPAHCFGYLPRCDAAEVSMGVHYSLVCHDALRSPELQPASGHPYAVALAEGPHDEVCGRWPMEAADPSMASAVRSDIPTLVLGGRFDPFAPPEILREGAALLSRSWVATSSDHGHNVLGASECLREIRNAWVENPTRAPSQPACATDGGVDFSG